MINKVFIAGYLAADPEVSYTQSGLAIVKIKIPTTEKWKDKQTGEQREQTEWHNIKFFGKQAETIAKYCQKGKPLYIEGQLKTDQYEKDGIKRYYTYIKGNSFVFLPSAKSNQSSQYLAQGQPMGQPSGAFINGTTPDDDIPF